MILKSYEVFGKIFKNIREDQGLSQKEVAKNLLTQRALSNLEQKGEMPSWIVLCALLQRLGKNPDYFITILSVKEYEYILWRKEILQSIFEGTFKKEFLETEMAYSTNIHPALQKQFTEFWKGYYENDISMMRHAIAYTVEDFVENSNLHSCLGTGEIYFILLCIEKEIEILPSYKAREIKYMRSLLSYIEERFQDDEQRKVYTKAVLIYGKLGEEANPYEILGYYCKAIELQRVTGSLNSLADVLRRYMRLVEKLGLEPKKEYQHGLWALEFIKEKYHIEERKFYEVDLQQEYYLLSEILHIYRAERNISVREIDELVCSGKTYRQLENGRRMANKSTFDLLAEAMDISFGLYSSDIVTNQYSDLKLVSDIKLAQRQHDVEKEKELLEKLELNLGDYMRIPQNMQFVSSVKSIAQFTLRNLDPEAYVSCVEKEIRMTIPEWNVQYKSHYYTRREMILVYYAALAYSEIGKKEIALSLLLDLSEKIEKSSVNRIHRAEEAILIFSGLKDLYSDLELYEKSRKKIKEAIAFCFECNRGDKLDIFTFEEAWIQEKTQKKDDKEKTDYFKCSLFISRFFYRKIVQEQIENYGIDQGYDF